MLRASRVNQRDRWLLSYADFVTLLFAVFVMMYATEKSRSAERPIQPVVPVAKPVPLPPKPPALLNQLRGNLVGEEQGGFLALSAEPRGVVITLSNDTLFKPGEARIRQSAEASFEAVGKVLSRYPNHMILEGHTDSVPIHTVRFRSNWELSTARSIAVMQLLEQRADIPQDRFSIGGSADNAPVTTDQSAKGRARNRRVDIIVLDDSPALQADLANR